MIAFDLDNTLIDLYQQLKDCLAKKDTVLLANDNYKLKTMPSMSNNQLWKNIEECYFSYKETPVYEGVSEIFDILYAATGLPVKIVTSRPIWSATWTHQLVNRFSDVPTIVCFTNGFSKACFLNGIDYFVDDRRKVVLELASKGKYVFVPRGSYNEIEDLPENIEYIDSVSNLIPRLKNFI